jgi:hypothetical protein
MNNKRQIFVLVALIIASNFIFGQIGIGTTSPETTIDIRATNHLGAVTDTDGVLVPRVNSLGVSGTQNGQLVYLITNDSGNNYIKGFYYWDVDGWKKILSESDWIEDTAGFQIRSKNSSVTKSSTTEIDKARHRFLSNGDTEVEMTYAASSSSGSSCGNGQYIFTLPNGLEFDITIHSTFSHTDHKLSNSIAGAYRIKKAYTLNSEDANIGHEVLIIPYSSTEFRALVFEGNHNNNYIGCGTYSLNRSNRVMSFLFTFKSL